MTTMTVDRYNKRSISYDVLMSGLNYRIDEIRAALGIEQLIKLDQSNAKRKTLTEAYRSKLSSIGDLIIPWNQPLENRTSSYHIFPILLPEKLDRKTLMEDLREQGIQTSIHYPAFGQFSYYKERITGNLTNANEISNRALTLPLYPTMATHDVETVCCSLIKAIRHDNDR